MTERAMNRTTTNGLACHLAIYKAFRNYPIKYLNFIWLLYRVYGGLSIYFL